MIGSLRTMFQTSSLRRHLLLMLTGATLFFGGSTAAAQAESYGELGHFGSAGTGHGQFQIPAEKVETHAFGVDPTDNSVYVGDEPTEGEYRIQKLSATGQFLASVSFKPAHPIGLEGIAVDPVKGRVYVLAVTLRGVGASIDAAKRAAEALYAFKTKQSGEVLESAVSGASKEAKEGVLASPATLETESEEQGHALLEPSGIAVDPTTHEVIIMGSEDQEAKPEESQLRVALERISENGAVGLRYVDKTNCFGGHGSAECEEGGVKEPNSPVVSQVGNVYVESFDQIWEIPSDFVSTQPSKLFIQFNPLVDELVEFNPGELAAAEGGGLSLEPEGASEGTIYTYADITQEKAGTLGFKFPGALAFKYSEHGTDPTESAEIGWTGGQSAASGGGKCTISFQESPSLAAGKEGDLFVFDPGPATVKHGPAPHVIEFGPGGTGCPTASASTPSATVKGQAVTEVPAGTNVTLSSTVEQANALSVEWSFGDGESETVRTDEFQTTKVAHKYTLGGEHTITETIHTDDLQTPEIVVEGKLMITGGSSGSAPTVKANPSNDTVVEGESAAFTASASGTPTPTVQWEVSTDEGKTWANDTADSGDTSNTLTLAASTLAQNGYRYRALFKNPEGTVKSTEAKLMVISKKQHEEEAAAKQKQEEEAAAEAKRREEEVAAAGKKHQEEEAAAAKRHQEEEAAAAKAKAEAEAKAASEAKAKAEAEAKKKEEEQANKPSTKPPTRPQLLAKALKTCKKEPKKKRAKCEATAKSKYGPKKKAKKKK